MPIEFPIRDLPVDLSVEDAIEAAYGDDLDWVADKLRRGVSTLVECEKQLVTWLYAAIRGRLRDASSGARCTGRPKPRRSPDWPLGKGWT